MSAMAVPFTRALEAVLRRLHQRFATAGGTRVQLPVLTGATSVGLAFAREEPDANYGVVATPNWDTTIYLGPRDATGLLIGFGTAAPANATIDVVVFRTED